MNVLTKTCACGRTISAPCEFHEIGIASARMENEGWGVDARGFVRCPECLKKREGER